MTGIDDGLLADNRQWGEHVAERLVERSAADGLDATNRGYMPTGGPGHWAPTPPMFNRALEPYRGEMRRFLSGGHCPIEPPPPFDPSAGSAFRAQVDATYGESSALDDADRRTATPTGTTNPAAPPGRPVIGC